MGYTRVRIDNEDLLEMFMDRVEVWTKDTEKLDLYEKYYENAIDNGCFEDAELNIRSIVDNDYVNYTSVWYEGDSDWEENEVSKHIEEGEYELGYSSYIEAVSDDKKMVLVRNC